MPPPPPPPLPPPMMGGPPPPPPPPPGGAPPARAPAGQSRVKAPPVGALLSDITKGKQLKKAVTNDRSAPIVGKVSGGSSGGPLGGAPAIPGGAPRPPGGLAPPVPGGNRARSNSDQGSNSMEGPPQLGGLFAGGMPKLKKRGGGIDTGANTDSSYTSDPESSRSTVPRPPGGAPPIPGAASSRPLPVASSTTSAAVPSVANLRKTLNPPQRPMSSASTRGPPPPIGKKPPPPPGSRKPSVTIAPPSAPPLPPSAAPPPPTSAPPPPTSAPAPPAPPPPPPAAAPRPPLGSPSRSSPPIIPPTPSSPGASNGPPSLAMQAAIRAAGQASPAAAPPPPPPPPMMSSPPPPPPPTQSPPLSAPPPPTSRAGTAPSRSMLDPSAYTLSPTNGHPPRGKVGQHRNSASIPSATSTGKSGGGLEKVWIHDPRWKFQDESILPKPRDFVGGSKRYRAGRGSSVPLDLSAYQ